MPKLTTLFISILVLAAGYYFYNNQQELSMETTNTSENTNLNIDVLPISHATMVLKWADKVIYTDPVGGVAAFAGQPEPDLILVTDIHSDHFNLETLQSVTKGKTVVVMPKVVAEQAQNLLSGQLIVMANGETSLQQGFNIQAVPMYNVPESADAYHTKGRGNGYVLEAVGQRVYISGDTGNTPEMRALTKIDLAFVSMNLPYTMTVEDAANAVLAFKPKQVSPYHYRGQDGLSDVNKFKELVNAGDPNIQVELRDFYPSN